MKNQNRLDLVKNSNVFKSPDSIINKQKEDYLLQISKLDVLNPLNTLKRGYSIVKKNEKVITDINKLKKDDINDSYKMLKLWKTSFSSF